MSEEKELKPWVKPALEFGPVLLFFIAYGRLKEQQFTFGGEVYEGFVVATALFIPLLVASTLILWKLTGHLSKMQLMTLVLVVGFGGLTVWLNDGSFFKMKPTILYLFFAGALGFGLLRGKSYMQVMMDSALPLTDEGWMALTKRMALLFLGLAVTNELVWRMLTEDTWVKFKTFGMPVIMFGFFMLQSGLISKYSTEEDES
ncbi:inner membrane-spanning protein YciB [Halocynthiibacter styelae]|uniref:Inner membrane-spanning protein YciB n=1 Tax=Halocynthiibacter styelae TaxID=2761955 RepID=A0A8J7IZ55_9RHOB|nr:inner membrane-spanning protein YciB [Paenihalocynthiibacter styelae]MBI1494944.1 septation protein IspZ [Paenihalocynthiibacter styelae]